MYIKNCDQIKMQKTIDLFAKWPLHWPDGGIIPLEVPKLSCYWVDEEVQFFLIDAPILLLLNDDALVNRSTVAELARTDRLTIVWMSRVTMATLEEQCRHCFAELQSPCLAADASQPFCPANLRCAQRVVLVKAFVSGIWEVTSPPALREDWLEQSSGGRCWWLDDGGPQGPELTQRGAAYVPMDGWLAKTCRPKYLKGNVH